MSFSPSCAYRAASWGLTPRPRIRERGKVKALGIIPRPETLFPSQTGICEFDLYNESFGKVFSCGLILRFGRVKAEIESLLRYESGKNSALEEGGEASPEERASCCLRPARTSKARKLARSLDRPRRLSPLNRISKLSPSSPAASSPSFVMRKNGKSRLNAPHFQPHAGKNFHSTGELACLSFHRDAPQ